jgi:predicted nucleic acid-binding protein
LSGLVLDCSAAIAWYLEDEATPYADSILLRVRQEGAAVPAIWPVEVANVLLVAERRRRLTLADSLRIVGLLGRLPVDVDMQTPSRVLVSVFPLAREQRLSAYDASYLELAMRLGLPLATLDTTLQRAAKGLGVKLVST